MKKITSSIVFLTLILIPLHAQDLVVLHTNDLHSMFTGAGPDANAIDLEQRKDLRGHFARLAAVIEKERLAATTRGAQVLLVDAGDFYGGTLFQLLGPDSQRADVPELDFLHENAYDFVTLGNHEFDAGEAGLLTMLQKSAKKEGHQKTVLSSSNILLPDQHPLKEFIKPYHIIETKAGKMLLLGLQGPDAARVSAPLRDRASFVGFDDEKMKVDWDGLADFVQELIDRLKKEQGVKWVTIVMHGGAPEDKKLVSLLEGVNLFIGGHTHQAYPEVLYHNGAWISQAGCYGQFLGKLELNFEKEQLKLLTKNGEHLIAINEQSPIHKGWSDRIKNYQKAVDAKLSEEKPFDDFISTTEITRISSPKNRDPDWAREVMSYVKKEFEQVTKKDLAFYFSSQALVRSGLEAPESDTPIFLSDLFRVLPMAAPGDELYGAQTARFYVTKNDARKLIRFLFLYRRVSRVFNPVFSDDLTYEIPWMRIPYFYEVKNLRWRNLEFKDWPELMPVATNSLVANYFPRLDSMTKGMLTLTPRDQEGNELKNIVLNGPREVHLFARGLRNKK